MRVTYRSRRQYLQVDSSVAKLALDGLVNHKKVHLYALQHTQGRQSVAIKGNVRQIKASQGTHYLEDGDTHMLLAHLTNLRELQISKIFNSKVNLLRPVHRLDEAVFRCVDIEVEEMEKR